MLSLYTGLKIRDMYTSGCFRYTLKCKLNKNIYLCFGIGLVKMDCDVSPPYKILIEKGFRLRQGFCSKTSLFGIKK